LGGLTYALTLWSASRHAGSAVVLSLGFGLLMLAGFLAVENRRGERAMMPLSLFRGRQFAGLNLLTFLLYGAFGAAMLLIPYVLITSGGYSPVEAGLAMLPLPVLMTSLSPTMGSLAARVGPRIPLAVGPAVVAVGMLLALPINARASYWTTVFPMMVVMAAGMTIAVAPLTSSVLGSVEERHVAMASGFNSAVARTGGLIATALLGAVLSSRGPALFAGFHIAMIVSAAVAATAGAVSFTTLGGMRTGER
jgi:predicted MFS family arabinose efflux permease